MKGIEKLEGRWQVVEISDLVSTYHDITPDPYVYIKVTGSKEVEGTFKFAGQSGELDGQVEITKENEIILTFTFEGEDESASLNGFGKATLIDDDTLKGELRFNRAATFWFKWKRVR